MTDNEAKNIIEKIMELSHLLGWSTILAQNPEGQILGLYSGTNAWVNYKTGITDETKAKPSH